MNCRRILSTGAQLLTGSIGTPCGRCLFHVMEFGEQSGDKTGGGRVRRVRVWLFDLLVMSHGTASPSFPAAETGSLLTCWERGGNSVKPVFCVCPWAA